MDDLQFRRTILADPKSAESKNAQQSAENKALLATLLADPAKKQFAQEVNQLDEKIKQALSVPIPDDLSDKLILRQTLAIHQVQQRRTRIHLALAASVALVGSLVFSFIQFSGGYNDLGDYALAHVYYEQKKFAHNNDNRVSLASLNQKMTAFNGEFSTLLGPLMSADYCRFGGFKSLHLVFQGKTTPVTIFVVPKNNDLTFTTDFHDKNFLGKSIGFSQADVIVIADKNEALNQWQEKINNQITWTLNTAQS